jgi:hypothetical protein
MDFEKIFAVFLVLSIIGLSIYIYISFSKGSNPPEIGKPFIPFTSDKKVDCSSVKVPCDPTSENPCGICDGIEQMSCISVNGENLCLPKAPDINCNSENGGRYIWTGYGFTQSKDWQCLCTKPEIYNGPDCNTRNPSYCSNGTLSKNLDDPLSSICQCGPGTSLLFRNNNTPMCISTDPKDGGGNEGLYGNYHKMPDWRNVYFMKINKKEWAKDIGIEFNYGDFISIENILNDEKYKDLEKLTEDMVNDIKKLNSVFLNSKFIPNYNIIVPYRYFTQTYIP